MFFQLRDKNDERIFKSIQNSKLGWANYGIVFIFEIDVNTLEADKKCFAMSHFIPPQMLYERILLKTTLVFTEIFTWFLWVVSLQRITVNKERRV